MKHLKTKNKRLLPILLILVMVVQVFPLSALAYNAANSEDDMVVDTYSTDADGDADSGEEIAETEEVEGSSLPEGWSPSAGTRTAATGTYDDVTS